MADETEEVKPLDIYKMVWVFDHVESYKRLIDRVNWLTQKVQELEKKGDQNGH